ncbi:MAG TPA: CoA-binding protein [Phycisphaerae bacterium]|nr:CoA-binding protein [Phycisphaerae bacterium]
MAARTVAVVGASRDRSKYGNKSLRAHLQQGWQVFPINPHETEVEGIRAYARLADVPVRLDRVTLYVPPEIGIALLDEIAAARPGELFVNPGAESEALLEAARARGLDPILACSIVDVGVSPAQL